MTWQDTHAAQLIRHAADLNDTDPDAARRLWATAAPLEILAAEQSSCVTCRIERLLSAATCLVEAGRYTLCMIVLERVLELKMDHAQLQETAFLFAEAFWLDQPVTCSRAN